MAADASASAHRVDSVEQLLSAGADASLKDKQGRSAASRFELLGAAGANQGTFQL